MTGRRATSPRKVAAIPLVTTRGRSARSATLTEHGATRIPELLRRLRRRGKCAWGSRGQGDGNRRPVVLCRPWGARPPRPRSPQRPPRLLPASAAFQAGSHCVEVWFCLRCGALRWSGTSRRVGTGGLRAEAGAADGPHGRHGTRCGSPSSAAHGRSAACALSWTLGFLAPAEPLRLRPAAGTRGARTRASLPPPAQHEWGLDQKSRSARR